MRFYAFEYVPPVSRAGQAQLFPITQPLWGRPSSVVWAGEAAQASPSQRFLCGWQRANASLGKGRPAAVLTLLSWEITKPPGPLLWSCQAQTCVSFFEKEEAPRTGVKMSWKPQGFRKCRTWEVEARKRDRENENILLFSILNCRGWQTTAWSQIQSTVYFCAALKLRINKKLKEYFMTYANYVKINFHFQIWNT